MSRWRYWLLFLSLALSLRLGFAGDSDSLDTLMRRYRIQVYESFRGDRPELDRRLAAAEEVIGRWQDRGAPEQEISNLSKWFQESTRASRFSPARPLPLYLSPGDANAQVDHEAASANNDVSADASTPAPSSAASRPAPTKTTELPPLPQVTDVPRLKPARTGAGSNKPNNSKDERPDSLPPADLEDLTPQKPRFGDVVTSDRLPALRLRVRKSLANERMLEHSPVPPAPATRVDDHETADESSVKAPQIEVDLAVLAAKIRSINLSLKAVEVELSEHDDWNVNELEGELYELSVLNDAADLIQIYYDAIPYEQRTLIEPLVNRGAIQALLAQRTFETRIRLVDAASRGETNSVEDQLSRLESIWEVMQRWKREKKK